MTASPTDPELQKKTVQGLLQTFSEPLKAYRADLPAEKSQAMEEAWRSTLEEMGIAFNGENKLVVISTLLTLIDAAENDADPADMAVAHLMTLLNSFISGSK